MTIAFAPAAVAAAKPVDNIQQDNAPVANPPARPKMPTFSPWKGKYLDIRPACWSLRNRPEEWEYSYGRTTDAPHAYIRHSKSDHDFKVGFGPFLWGGIYAQCNCSVRNTQNLSLWQRLQFRAAYKHWRRNHYLPQARAHAALQIENTNAHFRNHFV